jgi:hypothetical protein
VARSFSAAALYIARAEREITALIGRHGALVPREIEARLADRATNPIHPHLLTSALRNLLDRGVIVRSPPIKTRGKREISLFHLPVVEGVNKGFVEDSAARKRLLQTRFLGWAEGSSKYRAGLIGPAGNRALHAALTAPELAGRYALLNPEGKDVSQVLGDPVPGGSLDSAAVTIGSSGSGENLPVHVLFEVKNLRHWIYPSSWEVYQLLHKAAGVQLAHPEALIAPALICRRRQYWAFRMGIDLGFFVIEIHDQPMLPSKDVSDAEFEEVRAELGYTSLVRLDAPPPRLLLALREAIPPYVLRTARRWQSHGATLLHHYEALRQSTMSRNARSNGVAEMAAEAGLLPDVALDWQAEEEEPFVDEEA